MSKNINLRKKSRINYYEPTEPDFDEYVFCDLCNDYVYEYCSLHGPLLVIPDDEVPAKTNFPDFVPRAALTIPKEFLHLAPSMIPGAGIGVFSTVTLPRGVRFGPYRGQCTFDVTSSYCWQIYNAKHKPSHVVDAIDGDKSNWMRFVNCSRHCSEQNLVAFQYKGELYYRTIRTIPRFTELLVFYGSQFAKVLKINLAMYNSQSFVCLIKFAGSLPKLHKINNSIEPLDSNSSKSYLLPKLHKIPQDYELHEDLEGNNFAVNFSGSGIETMGDHRNVENDINGSSTHVSISYPMEDSPSNTAVDLNNNISNANNSDLKEIVICNTCNKSFRSKTELIEHLKTHLELSNPNLLSCKSCGFRTINRAYFEIHINLHDKNRPNQCSFCGYRFKGYMQRHIDSHLNVTSEPKKYQFPCQLCPYRGTNNKNLKSHIVRYHNSDFTCELCNFSSKSEYLFNRHKGIHILHKCEICCRVVSSSTSLRRHMRSIKKLRTRIPIRETTLDQFKTNIPSDCPSHSFM